MVALIIFMAAVTIFLRKRNSFQGAELPAASEIEREPHLADPDVLEMYKEARPIELTDVTLQELNGQSFQEMEQPRPAIELQAHEPLEKQADNEYR